MKLENESKAPLRVRSFLQQAKVAAAHLLAPFIAGAPLARRRDSDLLDPGRWPVLVDSVTLHTVNSAEGPWSAGTVGGMMGVPREGVVHGRGGHGEGSA